MLDDFSLEQNIVYKTLINSVKNNKFSHAYLIETNGYSNGLDLALAFAKYLDQKGIPVWIRHVVVPGITLYKEYLERLGEFMATLSNVKALDVLPYHSMGKVKYESLGVEYPLGDTREATKEEAIGAKSIILGAYKKAKGK